MGLFKSDTVPKFWDIAVAYNNVAGTQIIELLQNNPNKIRGIYGLESVKGCSNALLNELRCYASISSLAEIGLPVITSEDSESERVTKAGSYEWGTARFELEVFRRAEGSSEWVECGVAALKNAGGFRYRIHRLLDLITDNIGAQVGEWGRIGVRIKAAGYGYPQSYDRITFTGNWTQEFTWTQEHPTYVQINQYGNSPSPTPTPTPTPPPIPTLTLSLASGSTSAVANNDEKINLVVTDIPVGTQLSGSWFKAGVDTGITESVTTTGSAIQLSTLKLRDKLSGQYKLRLFYNGTGYLSNEVAVTVNPELTASLPSGTTTALTGSATPITITGKYFDRSGNVFISYNWLKSDNTVVYTSSGSNSITITNNTFTINLAAAQLQNATNGNYKFRLYLDDTSTTPFLTNEIAAQVTNPPTVVISPPSINAFYNTADYNIQITLSYFTVGQNLSLIWQREGVDLPASANSKLFNPSSGNTLSYLVTVNSFYPGTLGNYRLKVTTAAGQILYSNLCNFFSQNDSGGLG
jgi:hypothetical protein